MDLADGYAQAWTNLGTAQLVAGETAAARNSFQRALALAPDAADAHSGLGNANLREGNPRAAIRRFQEALQLDSTLTSGHYGLAMAYGALGDTVRAAQQLRIFQRYSEQQPTSAP